MSAIENKIDALLAMGLSADEIAHIAREQEKERNAALNIAERAKARQAIMDAFETYHKTLGIDIPVPKEVWDEVFDEYEKGIVAVNEHASEMIDALSELADIFGIVITDEPIEENGDDWTIIDEDELKAELKKKVKEFCENKCR